MRRTIVLLSVAVAAVVVLGGCSGTGAPPTDVRGASVQTLASDQVSAIVQFATWCGVLYQKSNGESNVTDFEDLGNGAYRLAGTNSDGGSFEYIYDVPNADGYQAGHGTISWPATATAPAKQFTTRWTAESMIGNVSTQSIANEYPDGAQLVCDLKWDRSVEPMQQEWNGTAKTPTGTALAFHMDRRQDMRDIITVTLPDGSRLQVTLPQKAVFGAPYWPDWAAGAEGSFRNADGQQFTFKALGSAASETWTEWQMTDSAGVSGNFVLEAGLVGRGQLQRGESVLGALRWTADWQGTLDLLGSGTESVTPSAASRDFRIQSWIGNAALLAPAPMY